MKKKIKSIIDIIFLDDILQGEEDILTEEEIEGYSFCNESKEKCSLDCSTSILMPTISGTN